MKLTDAQKRDYPDALDTIEAVVKLARAHFPRTGDVRLETAGSSPHATVCVPSYVIAFLLAAGRSALSQED